MYEALALPPLITPEMLLPTAVIAHIGQAIRKITSTMSLRQELRVAKFDIGSSFWPGEEDSLRSMYGLIERSLSSTAYLEPGMT